MSVPVFSVSMSITKYIQPPEQGSSQLSFSLDKYSGIASDEESTYLNVVNNGDKANDLTVILESQAFEKITLNPFDVSANETEIVPIKITIQDVDNQKYPVTIRYSCNGISDTYRTQENFFVIPNMNLIEVNYLDPILGIEIGDANNIEQNGEKELSFKVKSNSENAVYDNLYAVLVVEETTDTITITPSKLDIDPMGPKGQNENPYEFTIKTNRTPEGTYDLTVVLYSNGHVVASKTRTLDVV